MSGFSSGPKPPPYTSGNATSRGTVNNSTSAKPATSFVKQNPPFIKSHPNKDDYDEDFLSSEVSRIKRHAEKSEHLLKARIEQLESENKHLRIANKQIEAADAEANELYSKNQRLQKAYDEVAAERDLIIKRNDDPGARDLIRQLNSKVQQLAHENQLLIQEYQNLEQVCEILKEQKDSSASCKPYELFCSDRIPSVQETKQSHGTHMEEEFPYDNVQNSEGNHGQRDRLTERNNDPELHDRLNELDVKVQQLTHENHSLIQENQQLREIIKEHKCDSEFNKSDDIPCSSGIPLDQEAKEPHKTPIQEFSPEDSQHNHEQVEDQLSALNIEPGPEQIVLELQGVNEDITLEIKNDLDSLQNQLLGFCSVKGSGKKIHFDEAIKLCRQYINPDFASDTIPKDAFGAALARRFTEKICSIVKGSICDPTLSDNKSLELQILWASDYLTDSMKRLLEMQHIVNEAAITAPAEIRQQVCLALNSFGFKGDQHPFIQYAAKKVQEELDLYRTLSNNHKTTAGLEKLIRLMVSLLHFRLRSLGVTKVIYFEAGSEFDYRTMDHHGDDDENKTEVDICWFPLIVAYSPGGKQTMVSKAKVLLREPLGECQAKRNEENVVLVRQHQLNIYFPLDRH